MKQTAVEWQQVDVEKLAREHSTDRFKKSDCPSAFNQTSIEKDFIRGFNKAMEEQQRMYSEEEVLNILVTLFAEAEDAVTYFEQHKKK
jgi:hypothetical protein